MEEVREFPEQWKKSFEGLAYLGFLEKTFSITQFHEFTVRNLTPADKIEISKIASVLDGKSGYGRMYKAAVVAAGLITVDGQEIVLVERNRSAINQKYEYVVSTYHDAVIERIYREIDSLEIEALRLAYKLGVVLGDEEAVLDVQEDV